MFFYFHFYSLSDFDCTSIDFKLFCKEEEQLDSFFDPIKWFQIGGEKQHDFSESIDARISNPGMILLKESIVYGTLYQNSTKKASEPFQKSGIISSTSVCKLKLSFRTDIVRNCEACVVANRNYLLVLFFVLNQSLLIWAT